MGAFTVIYNKKNEPVKDQVKEQLVEAAKNIRSGLPTAFFQDGSQLMMSMETGRPMISQLAELDISGGNKLLAVADLRIDNFTELSSKYNIPDSISQVELLLHLYKLTGEDFINELYGDFAFVIFDTQRKKLLAARDHIGIRPCFYYDSDEVFVCSSDLELMFSTGLVPKKMDRSMVAAWFYGSLTYHPERMLYRHVKRLVPANYLRLDSSGTNLRPYFSWDDIKPLHLDNDKAYKHTLKEKLRKAIKDRIAHEGKVGTHLSGGLDSSSIAVLLSRELKKHGRTPECFSWSPTPGGEEYPRSEYPSIREICKRENFGCHYTDLTTAHIKNAIKADIGCNLFFPVEDIVREKAEELNVVQIFSGWGGDEGVAFNGRAYFMELFRKMRFYGLLKATLQRARAFHENPLKVLYGRLIRFLPPVSWLYSDLYKTQTKRRADFLSLKEYGIDTGMIIRDAEKVNQMPYSENRSVHLTQKQLFLDGHVAARCEDWAMQGLRHNLNYEFPLLDRELLSFALAIPSKYYFYKGWKRWLFRAAMEDVLPEPVQWRKTKAEPEFLLSLGNVSTQAKTEMISSIDLKAGRCSLLSLFLSKEKELEFFLKALLKSRKTGLHPYTGRLLQFFYNIDK